MSLRRNTLANYLGQGYLTLVELLVTPLYLQFLGAEAFGLVGFLALLHAWLRLLDLGLSPTLARQVAFARGQGQEYAGFGGLLRGFELIFLVIAVSAAVVTALTSDAIATRWLDARALDEGVVASCIVLMGIIVALRFFASLYGSGIRGLEDQVWLNAASAVMVTVRVVGALLIISTVSADIELFFRYHVAIAALEVVVLGTRFYQRLSLSPFRVPLRPDLARLRSVAPFALGIAYTSAIWVVVSQSDKLILSAVLPLGEFGYFTLVGLVSIGILILTGPISRAVLPRLTRLVAEGRHGDMLLLYRRASQFVMVVATAAALFSGAYAEPLVFAWTGDKAAAKWCADVLPWFAFGNGVLAVAAFQYYLQNALGSLRLHVIGSTVSAVIQVPIIYYAATRYGPAGAGIAWFVIRTVWFLIWPAVVHRRLAPGLHRPWLVRDLAPIFATGVAAIVLFQQFATIDLMTGRPAAAVRLVFFGAVFFVVVALSSSAVRTALPMPRVSRRV